MRKIFKMFFAAPIVATLFLGVQSCSSTKPLDTTQLSGNWTLKTMNDKDAKTMFEGPIPSVEFNFSDQQISGSAGCNRYFASFKLTDGNTFTADKAGSTMMACMHKNEEPAFLKAIAGPSYKLGVKNDLLIFTKDNKDVLVFEKGEKSESFTKSERATAENIAGEWTLNSITGEDLKTLFTDKVPSINFDNGKVSGNGGCNSYRGTYTITDGTITFGPLMSTKMACPSLSGENKFTQALANPVVASINDGLLTFYQGDKEIMRFSK